MRLTEEMRERLENIERKIEWKCKEVDRLIDFNQWKVLHAFHQYKISDYHFAASTGYGYNDSGREQLDQVYAAVFGAESGLVRPHFASGTHTIGTALFGVLRPGDHLLFITGRPYDTLHKVIGKPGDGTGSLRDWGVEYDEVALLPDGTVDWEGVRAGVKPNTRVIGIQRSRGYAWRPSFSVAQIGDMAEKIKKIHPRAITFVDNCYGEFTEEMEPPEVGIDLTAGSLIKNPGGGIVPSGGYVVGKREWVERAGYRLTAPGIGGEIGAIPDGKRLMFQGLFLAPHAVGQALKGSVFASACLEELGFETHPHWTDARSDLIQAVRFSDERQLIAFVQSIQQASPVDAHVNPIPWDMPGYKDPVIMAAGTFIQGGSLELSADAPIRPPYTAYVQGGLTYSHVKYAILHAIENLSKSI